MKINMFELKKMIVWDYGTITNCAIKNKLQTTILTEVLNAQRRNQKVENFLIKRFDLPDDFFSIHFGKEIPKLLKTKPIEKTKPKLFNKKKNKKIKNLEQLKKYIIETSKSLSAFAKISNLRISFLIDVLNARQRHQKIENFLIEKFDLPDDFFVSNSLDFQIKDKKIDYEQINNKEEKLLKLKKIIRHKYNSQSAFARAIGFNVSTLNKYLNGRGNKNSPKNQELQNIIKKDFDLPDFFL